MNTFGPKKKRKSIVKTNNSKRAAIPIDFKPNVAIGVDPGVNTGFAVADCKENKLLLCSTVTISQAIMYIYDLMSNSAATVAVVIEDARYASGSRDKLLGAGSIRRDSKVWEDFMEEMKELFPNRIHYTMRSPITQNKIATIPLLKMPLERWQKMFEYTEQTSGHARDAATYILKYLK